MSKKTEEKKEVIKVKCIGAFSLDGIKNIEIGSIVELSIDEYNGLRQYGLVKKMEE